MFKRNKFSNDLFKSRNNVYRNYSKIIIFLAKNRVDFTLSKKKIKESNIRSIYINISRFEYQEFDIRISDHSHNHHYGTKPEYNISIEYNKKVKLRRFKKELKSKAKIIHRDVKELKEEKRNLSTPQKMELKKLKRELSSMVEKERYLYLTRGSEFGFASFEEKIRLIKRFIVQEG